jgi:hypothetical protein
MLAHIIITSLFVFGYCCIFWEGMIFDKVGNWLDERLPEWLAKPLYQCYICSCFWWGSLLYYIMWRESWLDWFVTVVAAMGLNAALSKLFAKEEITVKNEY